MNILLSSLIAILTSFFFSLDGRDKSAIRLTADDTYDEERGYGFDFTSATRGTQASLLSVHVPDGNYRVTVTLGSRKHAATTTVRAESRRLMLENISTRKGQFLTYTFVVNKRNTTIYDAKGAPADRVRIKDRERGKLNWDDKLTIEINGQQPACSSVRIEPADSTVTTLYLCGNSTVVDQDYEPWASWGQMIPRWFDDRVAIANYAESGETASTFIAAGRLRKILSCLRPGDCLLVEFGHNDQKQHFAGAGAYYNFATCLKQFVDEARSRGAIPLFVTPTQRRSFDLQGRIQETHADYPEAMRWVAEREQVPVIELHELTRTFFQTLGIEGSKQAFVHYPANTFPGQTTPLADNTHFNPYGAYEIALMVVSEMRRLHLPVTRHLLPECPTFSPERPDDPSTFRWTPSPFHEMLKPDGN